MEKCPISWNVHVEHSCEYFFTQEAFNKYTKLESYEEQIKNRYALFPPRESNIGSNPQSKRSKKKAAQGPKTEILWDKEEAKLPKGHSLSDDSDDEESLETGDGNTKNTSTACTTKQGKGKAKKKKGKNSKSLPENGAGNSQETDKKAEERHGVSYDDVCMDEIEEFGVLSAREKQTKTRKKRKGLKKDIEKEAIEIPVDFDNVCIEELEEFGVETKKEIKQAKQKKPEISQVENEETSDNGLNDVGIEDLEVFGVSKSEPKSTKHSLDKTDYLQKSLQTSKLDSSNEENTLITQTSTTAEEETVEKEIEHDENKTRNDGIEAKPDGKTVCSEVDVEIMEKKETVTEGEKGETIKGKQLTEAFPWSTGTGQKAQHVQKERSWKNDWFELQKYQYRKSNLTSREQMRYNSLHSKYAVPINKPKRIGDKETAEIEEYRVLHERVVEEQKDYQQYLEKLAQTMKSEYNFMAPEADRYFKERLAGKKMRVQSYPKYYNPVGQFDMMTKGPPCQLLFVRSLMEMGSVPKMVIPNMDIGERPKVPLDYKNITKHCPPCVDKRMKDNWNHEPCSKDQNCEILSKQYKTHISIASSAIVCLVNNHGPKYDREWEIPFTVKDYELTEGNKKFLHRVVYIDNPLPQKELTGRDKNTQFYKYALRANMARLNQVGHMFVTHHHHKTESDQHHKEASVLPQQQGAEKSHIEHQSSENRTKLLSPIKSPVSLKAKSVENKTNISGKSDNADKSSDDPFCTTDVPPIMDDIETFGMDMSASRTFQKLASANDGTKDKSVLESSNKIEDDSSCPINDIPVSDTGQNKTIENVEKSIFNTGSSQSKEKEGNVRNDVVENCKDASSEQEIQNENNTKHSSDNVTQDNLTCKASQESDEEVKSCNFKNSVNDKSNHRTGQINEHANKDVKSTKVEIPVLNDTHMSSSASDDESDALVIDVPMDQQIGGVSGTQEVFEEIADASIVQDNIESPASPLMDTPASPVAMETPASPTNETPESPDLKNEMQSFPMHSTSKKMKLDSDSIPKVVSSDRFSPLSPDRFSSPDVKTCKIIPLQRESEEEFVIDNSKLDPITEKRLQSSYQPTCEVGLRRKRRTRSTRSSSLMENTGEGEGSQLIDDTKIQDIENQKTCGVNNIDVKKERETVSDISNIATEMIQKDNEEFVPTGSNLDQTNNEKEESMYKDNVRNSHSVPNTDTSALTSTVSVDLQMDTSSCHNSGESSDDVVSPRSKVMKNKKSLGNSKSPRRRANVIESDSDSDKEVIINPSKRPLSRQGSGDKEDGDKTNIECEESSRKRQRSGRGQKVTRSNSTEATEDMACTRRRGRSSVGTIKKSSLEVQEELKQEKDTVANVGTGEEVIPMTTRRQTRKGVDEQMTEKIAILDRVKKNLREKSGTSDQSTDQTKGNESEQPKKKRGRTAKKITSTDSTATIENPSEAKETDVQPEKSEVSQNSAGTDKTDQTEQASEKVLGRKTSDEQTKKSKPHHAPVIPGGQSSGVSLDNIMQAQEKLLDNPKHHKDQVHEKYLSQFKFPDRHNITYHMWSLGNYNVMIRCSYHGVYKDAGQKMSFLHVSSKLEYQVQHGVEQVTQAEITKDWVSAYIRPNCKIIRIRVDPLMSNIVSVKEEDLSKITPQNYGFNPADGFQMLANVFHRLHQCTPGQYLLHHSPGSSECQIKKSTDTHKGGSYDLHMKHLGFGSVDKPSTHVPWIPIDTTFIQQRFHKKGRIPATFEPRDYKGGKKSKKKKKGNH